MRPKEIMNPSWAQLTAAGPSTYTTTKPNDTKEEMSLIPPPLQPEQTIDTSNKEGNSETSSSHMETSVIENPESQTTANSGDQRTSKEIPFSWVDVEIVEHV
jgi:hypothetical protein